MFICIVISFADVFVSLMNDHKIKPHPKGSFYSIFCEKIV